VNSVVSQFNQVSDSATVSAGTNALVNLLTVIWGLFVKAWELVSSSVWWLLVLLILTFLVDEIIIRRIIWGRERILKRLLLSFLFVMVVLTVFGFIILPILEVLVSWLQGVFGFG